MLRWLPIISEASGIPAETLEETVTTDDVLPDVIADERGDLAAVEAALQEALRNNPDLQPEDVEQHIADLLHGAYTTD